MPETASEDASRVAEYTRAFRRRSRDMRQSHPKLTAGSRTLRIVAVAPIATAVASGTEKVSGTDCSTFKTTDSHRPALNCFAAANVSRGLIARGAGKRLRSGLNFGAVVWNDANRVSSWAAD